MRPGPSTDDLAAGLAVGVRVDVIRGGRVLATGVPVSGVKLEWSDSSRAVPGQLVYDAPLEWLPDSPLDALNVFGQRSFVTALYEDRRGNRWEIPLGEFVHTDWKADRNKISVTAADLMQLLEQNPAAWPSSPPSGATTLSELRRLVDEAVPVVLDTGVPDLYVPRATQWGTSRTESVQKLADSQNFGLRSGADGALHAFPIRHTASLDVLYTHESGLLIDAPRKSRAGARRPNRWYVTGSEQGVAGDEATKWTATRLMTAPPYEPEAYGYVTSHKEFSAASSQSSVEKAADTYMKKDLAATESRSLEVVSDARIEVGDVVGAVTAGGEKIAGRVTAYSLPLSDPGASMRIDIEVMEE